MKKISASFLEVLHLAAVSILFTLTVWIASFPGPLRSWSGSGFNAAGGPGATGEITSFLDLRGPWIAGIDFPFGLPVGAVEHFRWWPENEGGCVAWGWRVTGRWWRRRGVLPRREWSTRRRRR